MKKAFLLIIYALGLTTMFSSCEKDNMPGPNAIVYGTIKDKVTGKPVETELINGSSIEAFELGYPTQVLQRWLIKNDGQYRNNLVFAANYDFQLRNNNFFPISLLNYSIKPGENQLDFTVDPYLRVNNCKIVHDPTGKKVTATFNLEAGGPNVRVRAVRLYAFSDIYVGEATKFGITGASVISYAPSKTVDNGLITLTIDLAASANLFPAGRDYFFRVGALADLAGVGTIRHNYAPNVKITL